MATMAGHHMALMMDNWCDKGIEESTCCFAREIMRSWIRQSGRISEFCDTESVRKRLEKIFSIDFPEELIGQLCQEIGQLAGD